MKIAFLTPEYPHAQTGNSGGIGSSIYHLSSALQRQGHEVRILVYGQKLDRIFEDNNIIIQQIKNVKFKGISWWLTRKKIEKIINELHNNKSIDLVEAPDWTGITSYIKTECPIVIRLNGSDTYFCHLEHRPVKWVNLWHEKKAFKSANACISVSKFTANLTNNLFQTQKEIEIIHNGIDMRRFSGSKNEVEPFSILYFGSLIRKKGLLELALIFNLVVKVIPNAKLTLIGKDVPDIISGQSSTWQMMKELFSEDALVNTKYLGGVPYEEIIKHIDNASICVFPSFAEALPVSWIEAMAKQKPIVASNVGWACEMINDGENGYLVDPTNHELYAERITELLLNKELSYNFGIAARKKAQDSFDINIIATQSAAFYKKIITKS